MTAHGAAAAQSTEPLSRSFYDALAASESAADEAMFDGNAARYAVKARRKALRR